MKKNYYTPAMRVHQIKARQSLLAESATEDTYGAKGQGSGSFRAPRMGSFDDDYDD